MAGFEASGLPGSQAILTGFKECKNLETFISSFQQENCILLNSLNPGLQLLDLQGLKRFNFHQNVMADLLEKLLDRINMMNCDDVDDKIASLLNHIFQFVHVDAVRPVIMAALKKQKDIKQEYIELISTNDKIYRDCPLEVKRLVWMKKHPLFGDAVGPILNKYIEEKHKILFTIENIKVRNFFSLPPRQRRQKVFIKELISMIGSSIDLYNLVLQFLRTLFLRTKEEHYCSLRGELLMAFHDADVKEIRQVDPCHKFTWCLDACIRDKSIDSKRLKELQTFLDGIKKGQEEVMGDIAMILCEPYATNTIVSSVLQQLNKLIKVDLLPRSSQDLMFLIRLLTLSVGSWTMIKTQNFKESPMNPDIITKFLPMMLSVMLDNIHCGNSNWTVSIPESIWSYLKEDQVAQMIFSYFIAQLISHDKRIVLEAVLPHFARALKSQPINTSVLNLIVHNALRHLESFSDPTYCILFFDQFLFVWKDYEEILHHVLRLLWYVHEKIERQELVRLLTATQPSAQHSEMVHDLYSRLVDLVASSKASTPSSVEQAHSLSPSLQLSPGLSPGMLST